MGSWWNWTHKSLNYLHFLMVGRSWVIRKPDLQEYFGLYFFFTQIWVGQLVLTTLNILVRSSKLPMVGNTWEKQTSGVNLDINSVFFIDANDGWAACGGSSTSGIDQSTILHTTDGGKNWVSQPIHTSDNLNSLQFINSLIGWAVGRWGRILHTIDGGITWIEQSTGEACTLNSVFFTNSSSGWTIGRHYTGERDSNIILHNIDGGDHIYNK